MAHCAILTAAALLAGLTGCAGIQLLDVAIGGAVERGTDLTMVCKVNPNEKKIYRIQWYKDVQEFYRHLPENSNTQVFPVPGTRVNRAKSNGSSVVLEDVDLDTEGMYSCEVTEDYPFSTATVNGTVTVVETPQKAPTISSESVIHRDTGDVVRLNCTSSASRPAVNLTWLINGAKTGDQWTTLYPVTTDAAGLETTVLGLDFRLREEHFRLGVVSLKCKAQLFNVYYSGSEVKVHRRSMAQRSSQLGSRMAGGVAAPKLLPATLASGLAFIFARNTMATT